MSARVVKFGENIKAIGRRLATLGMAAGVPFAASMKVFASFDDQMRAVKAVTGATGKEFEDLTEKAKLLGRTTSFTASQVASAMLELGRAGFAPKEIDEAVPSILNLARATGTELATSAEICANTLRSFELPASEMVRVSDVMVAAANNSAQTMLLSADYTGGSGNAFNSRTGSIACYRTGSTSLCDRNYAAPGNWPANDLLEPVSDLDIAAIDNGSDLGDPVSVTDKPKIEMPFRPCHGIDERAIAGYLASGDYAAFWLQQHILPNVPAHAAVTGCLSFSWY